MTRLGLSREENASMFARAFVTCPDLFDDESVMVHIHRLGLSVSSIGAAAFDALLNEARSRRRDEEFQPLGDLAAQIADRIGAPDQSRNKTHG